MTTALGDLAEMYRREVAVPGMFDIAYPTVTEAHIIGSLADSFAEAQLDGWFAAYTLDVDVAEIDPEVSLPAQALIVNYGASRLIRAELRAANSQVRYKAGPVEYEVSRPASFFTQLLKDLAQRRKDLLDLARAGTRYTYVLDGYSGRLAGEFLAGEAPPVSIGAA